MIEKRSLGEGSTAYFQSKQSKMLLGGLRTPTP